ncbi:hypothetical protein GCM10009675_06900 [Prauserella alba]|uniref:Uncharacterized protein n=1 Tax=Prauserella alba TaxID=176898 RepID=A0ABN1V4N5_9PSEU
MRYKLSGTSPNRSKQLVCTRETGLIAVNAKKLAGIAAVALVLFFVIAQPGQAAGFVNNIIGFLRDAAEAVITFVSNIFT